MYVATASHFPLFGRAIFRSLFFAKNTFLWLLEAVLCNDKKIKKVTAKFLATCHCILATCLPLPPVFLPLVSGTLPPEMRLCFATLQRFVRVHATLAEVAERLTERVAEVDAIEDPAQQFANVVVGQVKNLRPHPNADRLRICDISDGETNHPVVCGAANIAEGALVILARVGATLPGDFHIEQRKIRGEVSAGMACSAREMGIGEDHDGIIILPPNSHPPGTPAATALGLLPVLEFENTSLTNRVDLFSHLGFAREMVALDLASWQPNHPPDLANMPFSAGNIPIDLDIQTPQNTCPFWAGAVLNGVSGEAPSPAWLQKELLALGMRPISALVDVTNLVMAELGMPLHAFDAAQLGGANVMQLSKKGQAATLLDSTTHELPEGTIVITGDDGATVRDICGVMGAAGTGVSAQTSRILLHAPVYAAAPVRRAANALAHRTDAATIFEKGVPPAMARAGLCRALSLLQEIFPGSNIEGGVEERGEPLPMPPTITCRPAVCSRVYSAELSAQAVANALESLGCQVEEKTHAELAVTPPVWRPDLLAEHDLVEEVIRLLGLAGIAAQAPANITLCAEPPLPRQALERQLRALFSGTFRGVELLSFSFLGESLLKKAGFCVEGCPQLLSPLGADTALLRPSLLPRMLEAAHSNAAQLEEACPTPLFEIGAVFGQQDHQIQESVHAAVLFPHRDFFEIKSLLPEISRHIGRTLELGPLPSGGRGASLMCRGQCVGELTELTPSLLRAFALGDAATALQLRLGPLADIPPAPRPAPPKAPRFPAVSFDVALLVPAGTTCAALEQAAAAPHLEAAEALEVFSGSGIPAGFVSITLHLRFRCPTATLTAQQAEASRIAAIASLASLGAKERF